MTEHEKLQNELYSTLDFGPNQFVEPVRFESY